MDLVYLQVDHERAPDLPPDPHVPHDVIAEHLLRHRGHQGDGVGHGQADQVAVGG